MLFVDDYWCLLRIHSDESLAQCEYSVAFLCGYMDKLSMARSHWLHLPQWTHDPFPSFKCSNTAQRARRFDKHVILSKLFGDYELPAILLHQVARKIVIHKGLKAEGGWALIEDRLRSHVCWYICKCIVNIAIACSIYDIRIMAKNIAMYWYTGVSLQAKSADKQKKNKKKNKNTHTALITWNRLTHRMAMPMFYKSDCFCVCVFLLYLEYGL